MRILKTKSDSSKFTGSWTEGQKAENVFVRVAKERGWEVIPATREQNMFEHWDYLLKNQTAEMKVDVKAAKRINRKDLNTQYEWLWIELTNIAGYVGWLYGKADYICFQWFDAFWMIKRTDLVKRVTDLVTWEIVGDKSDAYYKLYRRAGRRDLITLVRYSDIEDLATKYENL